MSNGFTQLAATTGVVPPDPSKRVKYTLGMLLGVDDFNQEFAYLSGRDRWMARDLVGYGTLSGLKVSLDTSAKGPRLSVTAGTALSPRGQMICLHPAQCAYLNDWLTANQASLHLPGSPPSSLLSLWLVVCYRECPVDPVPIAGEPCRAAADLMAPSRWVDDFRLELRQSPPVQEEEDAIRDFVAWLDQIQITDGPSTFPNVTDFENALRAALMPGSSPLDPATYFHLGSPVSQIQVNRMHIGEYLRAAFRLWATELRPLFHACWPSQSCSCSDTVPAAPPSDECLLLAEINVPVVNVGPGQNWQVDGTQPVTIDESRRPILLHTRLLQEWMQSGLGGGK